MAPPSNPSVATGLLKQKGAPLTTHIHCSSSKGLNSVSTLIVGQSNAVLIDPPFLISDAVSVVSWIKATTSLPLAAVFVTHHHPDHYWSGWKVLEEWPEASFFAAPYVVAGINREYDDKCLFWPKVYGDDVSSSPRKPEEYPFSFFILPGNTSSPVVLLGPIQGDSVDHSVFWLPRERTIITGDCMYGNKIHLWAEEIETPTILEAWKNVLDLFESLEPTLIIPGHAHSASDLDRALDLEHNRKYLDLFATKIAYAEKQPSVKEIYSTFEKAFPACQENLDFFLGKLSGQFGEGGDKWEENRHHNVGARTIEGLEGYIIGNSAKLRAAGK